MTPLSPDMTYQELKQWFDESDEFRLALKQKNRRAKKKLRKEGEKNEELMWHLFIQKIEKKCCHTLYRKNLHVDEDDILPLKVDEKIIRAINQALFS